jgi:flagellar M-ring protein FliF
VKAVFANLMGLGRVRLFALGGVAAALLLGIALLVMRGSTPPMALLYGELDTRDAGAVVAALERQRIPFRITGGGTQIMVGAEDVARLRLSLAREGLPAGGSVGYELFDRNESLTTTPFQQDMNRLRALEGELQRTIRGLSGVRAVRVHLVLPRREAFSRERADAQASVVLSMQGSQRLDREGVQAVLHLVATAVPGLQPRNISIIDSRGELLARGGQAVGGAAGAATQEEMRRTQEMRMARGIEEMLERTLGVGRVRAEASIDMDFDRVESREERFDPENQVPRSTQSTTENNRGAEPGNVSVANNLPGGEAGGAGGGSSESRQEETTNFEIGRTTRSTLREHPVIRRLSVAVLVDGVTEPVEGGPPRVRERTPEELTRLASLVRSAVGFNEQRGDRVEVVSMRFAETEVVPPPPGMFGIDLPQAMIARLIETAVLALVALLAILLVGRPVARRLAISLVPMPALGGGVPVAALDAEGKPVLDAEGKPVMVATLPDGTPAVALPPADDEMVIVANVEGKLRASSVQRLIDLVNSHPEGTLNVVRRWLDPGEEA